MHPKISKERGYPLVPCPHQCLGANTNTKANLFFPEHPFLSHQVITVSKRLVENTCSDRYRCVHRYSLAGYADLAPTGTLQNVFSMHVLRVLIREGNWDSLCLSTPGTPMSNKMGKQTHPRSLSLSSN